MNFLSHYYLDRDLDNSWFFLGVSTPDLVSIFNRNVRLKKNKMPLIRETENTEAEISFYNGCLRHIEVDGIFHSSEFFREETQRISKILTDAYLPEEISRAFFVAHVAFELILDKILIQETPGLVESFYGHMEKHSLDQQLQMTEWVARTKLPGYKGFLHKFISRKYLSHYTDWDHVVYVLKKILMGVGVKPIEFLHDRKFIYLMEEYEEGLAERCFLGFSQLNGQLLKI
ncbi:MAG: hypothetical protein AAF696_09990 [Bacteroidota bacterium]